MPNSDYKKYKFTILSILNTKYPKDHIPFYKQNICNALSISAERLKSILYAPKNSPINIPGDKLMLLGQLFNIRVEDLYTELPNKPIFSKNTVKEAHKLIK